MGRRAKSPRTDYQREEVYNWENQFASFKNSTAPVKWFRDFLKAVCRSYKVAVPRVEVLPKTKHTKGIAALCWIDRGTLYFSEGYRSMLVLCHELAHWILDCYKYSDVGHHGARFVGVYLWLLNASCSIPLEITVPSAKKFGLKFRPPLECGPGKLKRYLSQR